MTDNFTVSIVKMNLTRQGKCSPQIVNEFTELPNHVKAVRNYLYKIFACQVNSLFTSADKMTHLIKSKYHIERVVTGYCKYLRNTRLKVQYSERTTYVLYVPTGKLIVGTFRLLHSTD